jgi:hypothetical protein
MKKAVLSLVVALFSLPLWAQSQEAQGPPQFLTLPILSRVAPPGLDHGHFVFVGDEGVVPGPLAPSGGATSFVPAARASQNLTTGTDRDVSDSSDSYEGETGAAGTTVLVGGSNHIYPGNCSKSAPSGTFGDCAVMAYSSVSGSSFSRTTISRTWSGNAFGITFDPGIDYDKIGNLYFSFGGAPLNGSYPNSVAVSKSTDGGVTWSTPVAVTFNRGKNFDDKYYLAIDRSSSPLANRIYVSWDRNSGFNQILLIASSSDGGATWTAPIKVNDGTTSHERVIGAYPAVDQNSGVVYDSWHDYAKNIIYVDKSTNGGATWGTDVAAATTHAGFGTDIGCVGGRSQGPAHALKVGPSGALYLVYADPVTSGPVNRGFDILLTKSTDGGATWSTPVVLNDDGGPADQFHPTLSVESNGAGGDKVTVTFYDRRDDPSNCFAHVYATQSTDSAATWSPNVRMTSASSDFDGNPNGPGDYSSSTPFSSAVWPFFCDHRASNPQTASGGAFNIFTVNVQ